MNFPRLFCVYSIASDEIVFTSVSLSACKQVLRTISEDLRHNFDVVRYDPWDPSATHHWVEVKQGE